jgi:hypothetical protein
VLPLGQDGWITAADIAMCIVELSSTISAGHKSLSVSMNDFIAGVKSSVPRDANVSIKLLTELFNDTISGTPLAPLSLPHQISQYLFASCRISGAVKVHIKTGMYCRLFCKYSILNLGFLLPTGELTKSYEGWAVVAPTALYLFDQRVFVDSVGGGLLSADTTIVSSAVIGKDVCSAGFVLCVPLGNTTVTSSESTASVVVAPVFSVLPVLLFADASSAGLSFPPIAAPERKSWHLQHAKSVEITLVNCPSASYLMSFRDETEAAVWALT